MPVFVWCSGDGAKPGRLQILAAPAHRRTGTGCLGPITSCRRYGGELGFKRAVNSSGAAATLPLPLGTPLLWTRRTTRMWEGDVGRGIGNRSVIICKSLGRGGCRGRARVPRRLDRPIPVRQESVRRFPFPEDRHTFFRRALQNGKKRKEKNLYLTRASIEPGPRARDPAPLWLHGPPSVWSTKWRTKWQHWTIVITTPTPLGAEARRGVAGVAWRGVAPGKPKRNEVLWRGGGEVHCCGGSLKSSPFRYLNHISAPAASSLHFRRRTRFVHRSCLAIVCGPRHQKR